MINKCCERHWRTVITNAGILGAVGEASNPTRQAWRASWFGVCTGLSDSVSMAALEADAACCSLSRCLAPMVRRLHLWCPSPDAKHDGSQRSLITQVDASSDEEFLLRPNSEARGARTDGKLPTTVPASPGVLFVAGLLREVGPTQRETDAEWLRG